MDYQTLLDACVKQEEQYQFERFSRQDALDFGLKLYENVKKGGVPVAIEIAVNGLVVFRYFPEGTVADSGLWLARKRRAVELMEMSSLRFLAWLEVHGESLESRKLAPDDYAAGGGGFPIRVRGTGMVGSVCVSGMPDHRDDHQLIVNTLAEWFGH